ncbi:MAG: MFS transporter [Pygmaiobacter sp.]
MQNLISNHRWSILFFGALVQICTGVPAAWGVFQRPVRELFGLSGSAASMIFALTIAAFGLGCVLGGLLQDRHGPRVAGVAGTLLLSGGFVLSGQIPAARGDLLFLSFSLPVGLGCAFLYPSVMTCAQKWYCDKKGTVTGVIGCAAGLSGAVLTLLGRWFLGLWGLRGTFVSFGALIAIVCGGACSFLSDPPATQAPGKDSSSSRNYTVRQMLKTRQYWLVFSATALATPSVLLFSPLIVELGQQRGLSEAAAHLSIILGSVASAAGRLSMPVLSDKVGRRNVDLGLFCALTPLSFAFIFANGWFVILGYSALTFCYSGEAAVLPALCTDLFGTKHAGVNYGFIALGMSLGSVAFALLAGSFSALWTRSFLAIAAAAAGFAVLLFLKPTSGDIL